MTIHEDSMSIADSIFSMRMAPNPLSGRYSKQSSLSIHSTAGNIRTSPIIPRGTTPLGFKQSQQNLLANNSSINANLTVNHHTIGKSGNSAPDGVSANGEPNTRLPRQESSFTQEEIYR